MSHVVVAPCAMKGALSARAIADIVCAAFAQVAPDVETRSLPIADGGEGTIDALRDTGRVVRVPTQDLKGRACEAPVLFSDDGTRALIECASVIGLPLVDEAARDPRRYGSGALAPLIAFAIARGARHVALAIGGTATVDGGLGLLSALGARVVRADGARVPPAGVGLLGDIAHVDLAPARARLAAVTLTALVDVRVPLTGARGARLFMEQKGVDAALADDLDDGLARFARAIERDDLARAAGAGAGGGLGFAALLLANRLPHAVLTSGAEHVLSTLDVDRHLAGASLVVTAEGRFDGQTAEGKALSALAARASKAGVPVCALVGERVEGAPRIPGLTTVLSIARGPMSRADMLRDAAALVDESARELAALHAHARTREDHA